MRQILPLAYILAIVAPSQIQASSSDRATQSADQISRELSDIRKTSSSRIVADEYLLLKRLIGALESGGQAAAAKLEAAKKEMRSLEANHPHLTQEPPNKLTSERAADRRAKIAQIHAAALKAGFSPRDDVPQFVQGDGNEVLVVYQFRIEAHRLPPDAKLQFTKQWRPVEAWRQGQRMAWGAETRKKTIQFQQVVSATPVPFSKTKRSLLCTSPNSNYASTSPEEDSRLQALGHRSVIPWENPNGTYRSFCGVISTAGEVLHDFQVPQTYPGQVLKAIEFSDDGKLAIVAVGELIRADSGGESSEVPWVFRRVLSWRLNGPQLALDIEPGKSLEEVVQKAKQK